MILYYILIKFGKYKTQIAQIKIYTFVNSGYYLIFTDNNILSYILLSMCL